MSVLTRVDALRSLLRRIYADLGNCMAVDVLVVHKRERHSVDATRATQKPPIEV